MAAPEILTALQRDLLARLSRTPLAETFFLTGGTALAACYRRHRLSEDLDFFTGVDHAVPLARPILEGCARAMGGTLEVSREFGHFLESAVIVGTERILIHVAQDSPYRLAPVRRDDPILFPVDNELDIACNKLAALFDRAAGKDFVDVYFIHRESIPLDELIPKANRKHVGLDSYYLAQSFQRIEHIDWLPHMLKPLTLEELKQFYFSESKRQAARIQPGA